MTERARYWADLVAAWARSGLSQAEFCRRRGIKAVNFAWWKRRLERDNKSTASPARPTYPSKRRGPSDDGQTGSVPIERRRLTKASERFVEVQLTGGSLSLMYEVVLADGRSIRVPSQFDPQVLSRLITAVESC